MSKLFHENIERISESDLIVGKLVRAPNLSEAKHAKTANRDRWVLKCKMEKREILAESLGWLLSNRLKVPTPYGAVVTQNGKYVWLSKQIDHTDFWDSSKMSAIHNISQIGSMLAIDAIVYNEDRHHRNILLEPDPDEYKVKVWSIDLAKAEIGRPDAIDRIGLGLPNAAYVARGIPIDDIVRQCAMETATIATQMDDSELRAFILEACGIAGETKVDLLFSALSKRCANAPMLVDKYLTAYSEVLE